MDYLLDTNVLLRLFDEPGATDTQAAEAVDLLVQREQALCFAEQNAAEFWNVMTRPLDCNGFGLTPAQVEPMLDEIERLFGRLPAEPHTYRAWRRLVREAEVSGVQVHDARLAATMQVHGVGCVLTLNPSDFERYAPWTGLAVVHPREVVASA